MQITGNVDIVGLSERKLIINADIFTSSFDRKPTTRKGSFKFTGVWIRVP